MSGPPATAGYAGPRAEGQLREHSFLFAKAVELLGIDGWLTKDWRLYYTAPAGVISDVLTPEWRNRFGVEKSPAGLPSPLMSWEVPVVALVLYLFVVYTLQAWMKNREPFKLSLFVYVHNLFLSIASLVLLVLVLERVLAKFLTESWTFFSCSYDHSDDASLFALYYANYMLKYYELLDTVFMVLKKRPVIFLHVYHHIATLLLTYFEILGLCNLQWGPIHLNLAVHAVMYFYYFLAAAGVRVWWKHLVTQFQIVQFIGDMFFAGYVFVYELAAPGRCAGGPLAIFYGAAVLFSYLVLFIQFYFKTYGGGKKATATAAKATKKA